MIDDEGGHGTDGVERRGLMFVLSSPSGAGKTTLSRLLIHDARPANPAAPARQGAVQPVPPVIQR